MSMPYNIAENIINVKNYGAVGDGVTIDDAAILSALTLAVDSHRILYFPEGVYALSRGGFVAKGAAGAWGSDLKIYGDGSAKTIIKLKDNCPGFQSTDTAKSIFIWGSDDPGADGSGNNAFSNEAKGFTLSIGAGNPKANGLGYIANNQGTIDDVVIKSEDPAKVGGIGLNCSRTGKSGHGSNLINNLKVIGFDTGIKIVGSEYGQHLQNIALEHQNIVGLEIISHPISIIGLKSVQKVTAIRAYDQAHLVLIDADLQGIAGITEGASAIVTYTNNTQVYLNNCKQANYLRMMNETQTAKLLTGTLIGQYSSIPVKSSVPNTLHLAPQGVRIPSPAPSTLAATDYYHLPKPRDQFHDITDEWNLAVASGKAGIAFPSALNWNLYKPGQASKAGCLIIPPHVKHIKGNFANISIPSSSNIYFNSRANKKALWLVEAGTDPLFIENLHGGVFPNDDAFLHDGADFFYNSSARQITLSGLIGGGGRVVSKPAVAAGVRPGDLYLIDVSLNVHMEGEAGALPQRMYARHLNPESGRYDEAKIYLNNAEAYIAGLKTEGVHRVLHAINSRVHVIGGMIYPVGYPAIDVEMCTLVDTDATFVLCGQGYTTTGQYDTLVSQKFGTAAPYVVKKADVQPRMSGAFFLHYNGDRAQTTGG